MSFKNFPNFVINKINSLFCEFKTFYHTYINDTVIFSAILEDHLYYLYVVLSWFE